MVIIWDNGSYYNPLDPCIDTSCGYLFECDHKGRTLAGAYVQIGTQDIRYCNTCSKEQPWPLKEGKQGFNHKIDNEWRV